VDFSFDRLIVDLGGLVGQQIQRASVAAYYDCVVKSQRCHPVSNSDEPAKQIVTRYSAKLLTPNCGTPLRSVSRSSPAESNESGRDRSDC
jgi:hypothetical protein